MSTIARFAINRMAWCIHRVYDTGSVQFSLSSSTTLGLRNMSTSPHNTGVSDSTNVDKNHADITFINRNPRNLEMMTIAWKRKGWKFQYPSKEYYHRLIFEKTNRLISAHVEHYSGVRVLSVSSNDLPLARHLYSISNISAARSVGRLLAYQCLQAGISSVCFQPLYNNPTSVKMQAFCEAIQAGGLALEEKDELEVKYSPGIDYDDFEAVEDLERRQMLVYQLSEESETKYKLRMKRHMTTRRRPWRKPTKLEMPQYTSQQ